MTRWHWIILGFITLLGLGLRLYGLDAQSLYSDELYSWHQSHYERLGDVITKGLQYDVYPPAYPVFLHYWQKAFGDSETSLRLPSALTGALWPPVIFLLGWRLFGRREGLIAAALVAVARTPIYFSQEARSYAMFIPAVILMGYTWCGMIRDERRSSVAGYVAASTVALYLHPLAVILVGLSGVVMAVVAMRDRRLLVRFAIAHACILLLFLPWLPRFIAGAQGATYYLAPPGIDQLARSFAYQFNRSTGQSLVALALLGYLAYRTIRDGHDRTELGLALWIVVPVAAVTAYSYVGTPIYTNRNMLICLPPLYLLVARSIAKMPIRPLAQTGLAIALSTATLGDLLFVQEYYGTPGKTQVREAVRFVLQHDPQAPNAPVFACAWFPEQIDYYFRRFGSDRRVAMTTGAVEHLPKLRQHLRDRRASHFWYVEVHLTGHEGFLDALREDYTLLTEGHFIKAHAYLFRVPPAATSRAEAVSRGITSDKRRNQASPAGDS